MISPISAADVVRYFKNSFVYIKGELSEVLGTKETEKGTRVLYTTAAGEKKNLSLAAFCETVEIRWPTAGYRKLPGGTIACVSYVRDGFKKAPSRQGLSWNVLRHGTEGPPDNYWQVLFNPVFDDEVLCSLAAFVGEWVYVQGMPLRLLNKGSPLKVCMISPLDAVLVAIINSEMGREALIGVNI